MELIFDVLHFLSYTMSAKRTDRQGKEPKQPSGKVQRTHTPQQMYDEIIRLSLLSIKKRTIGRQLNDEELRTIDELGAQFVEPIMRFRERTQKMSKYARLQEESKRCNEITDMNERVYKIWDDVLREGNDDDGTLVKMEPSTKAKDTRIDDFFDHDDKVYSDTDYDHNNNIKLKETRPRAKPVESAGELIVTEDYNDAEPMGFSGVFLYGKQSLPKKIQKDQARTRERQDRNGFVKPNTAFITAKDSNTQCPDFGQCKICFWCAKGSLGMSVKSIIRIQMMKESGENQYSGTDTQKAAKIAASRFKTKFYELRDDYGPEYACKTLAQIWNDRIRLMRHKYEATMTKSQMEESIDDFFNMADDYKTSSVHDKSLYEFTKGMYKTTKEKELEASLDSIEEERDDNRSFSFMPPEVDVDDFLYHFSECVRSDPGEIVLHHLNDLSKHIDYIGKNQLYRRIGAGPIDSNEVEASSTPNNTSLDIKHCYVYIQMLNQLGRLSSVHRQHQYDQRQNGMLYQNLGLLRDGIPGFSGIDSLRALKYSGSHSKSNKKGQYLTGETMGV